MMALLALNLVGHELRLSQPGSIHAIVTYAIICARI